MQVMHFTPFCIDRFVSLDKEGAETLVLIVKAAYDLSATGGLSISPDQLPIEWADRYYGEPGNSSLLYEADAALRKIATDVALIGHAYPIRKGDSQVDVSLKIGGLQKTVRVFGDRHWKKLLGFTRISKPRPFEKIPLIYERAFGGIDTSNPTSKYHEYDLRNPVGVGFRAKHSKMPIADAKLPNIENPTELISKPIARPAPTGFGFIAKNWKPRIDLGGTYDEKWMKTKMPLLPDDFDDHFNNAASPGLVVNGFLKGDETIEITNASPSGYLSFHMPNVSIIGSVLIDARLFYMDMKLDTVVIDTDLAKLILVWRGSWNVHKLIEDVRCVRAELKEPENGTGSY